MMKKLTLIIRCGGAMCAPLSNVHAIIDEHKLANFYLNNVAWYETSTKKLQGYVDKSGLWNYHIVVERYNFANGVSRYLLNLGNTHNGSGSSYRWRVTYACGDSTVFDTSGYALWGQTSIHVVNRNLPVSGSDVWLDSCTTELYVYTKTGWYLFQRIRTHKNTTHYSAKLNVIIKQNELKPNTTWRNALVATVQYRYSLSKYYQPRWTLIIPGCSWGQTTLPEYSGYRFACATTGGEAVLITESGGLLGQNTGTTETDINIYAYLDKENKNTTLGTHPITGYLRVDLP